MWTYIKATVMVLLSLGLWILSHFVALILGLAIAIMGVATIIKIEKEDAKNR